MEYNLGYDVNETALAIRREFDRRAGALGVTRAQWRVLSRLARQDGQRQVDLADALDIEPITLCRMIDRLSEAGLVERRADEADRRAWRIHLTGKAGPIIADLASLADAFMADILDGISTGEQAELRRLLEKVRKNIADHGSARRVS